MMNIKRLFNPKRAFMRFIYKAISLAIYIFLGLSFFRLGAMFKVFVMSFQWFF